MCLFKTIYENMPDNLSLEEKAMTVYEEMSFFKRIFMKIKNWRSSR